MSITATDLTQEVWERGKCNEQNLAADLDPISRHSCMVVLRVRLSFPVPYRILIVGSPKSIQVRRTSRSRVPLFAFRIASPNLKDSLPKRWLNKTRLISS